MSLLRTRSVSRCSEAVPTHFSYTRPRKVSNVRFIATSSNARRSGIKPSYFWYPLCLALGLGIGYQVRVLACPPDLPTPGSKEDHVALGALAADIDQLHIVKTLRAQEYNLHTDVALTESATGQPAWIELDIRNTIADDRDQKENKPIRTLTQSSMAGARGLGVQRAFWNPITRELVAVVWCGGALTGWPGLTHGGAIATMFEELFSRAVAGPDRPLSMWLLSVTYGDPQLTWILQTPFHPLPPSVLHTLDRLKLSIST